jgi:DUF1680 family protein
MYAGMADVAALTGDTRYLAAITKIWDNVVTKKLYLTGGAGALARGEAYGANYELPHDGYNETCAALALMNWNHRMFLLTGEAKYMDVLERTAFNGFLSGVSVSGDRFFYPNPLIYDGQKKNNHDHAGRAPWFGCACCPPNLMRTLASLTGYFYAVRDDSLYVNFYAASEGEAKIAGTKVKITQTTDYPWNGRVTLSVAPDKPVRFTLRIRIPGWVEGHPVPSDLYNYAPADGSGWKLGGVGAGDQYRREGGYYLLTREWKAGDSLQLDLFMPVRRVQGNDQLAATRGQVAFERGPVVYCFEQVDQPIPEAVSATTRITPRIDPALLGGVTVLEVDGARAIPYYAWNNRGLHPMAVWRPVKP